MVRLFGTKLTPQQSGKETARRLLAFVVREVWKWTELPEIQQGPKGKPFFLPSSPQRQFNLSHTDGLVLCVLSDEGAVGVDAEMVKPRKDGLPRYIMNDAEFAAFDGTWEDFTRIWTLKEAYAKYLGTSILPSRTIPVPPPVPFRCYEGEGWRAALCCDGELPTDIEWLDL